MRSVSLCLFSAEPRRSAKRVRCSDSAPSEAERRRPPCCKIISRPKLPLAVSQAHGERTESAKAADPGDFPFFPGSSSCCSVPCGDAPMGRRARCLPSIHELIHHDADDEHHDCAVTLFLSGAGRASLPGSNHPEGTGSGGTAHPPDVRRDGLGIFLSDLLHPGTRAAAAKVSPSLPAKSSAACFARRTLLRFTPSQSP